MTEEGRRAIHAHFWDDLRGAELARVLKVSKDHSKKPVSRAIRRLRHALSTLAEEPTAAAKCSGPALALAVFRAAHAASLVSVAGIGFVQGSLP